MSAIAEQETQLTKRQSKFIDAVLDPNVPSNAEAARLAGYKPKHANVQAAENLAKPYLREAIIERQQQITSQSTKRMVDVHDEFQEQLEFAKDLRKAAKQWLLTNNEIDLDPRATEIQVVYLDPNDTDDNGKPVQKKAPLSDLLALVRGIAMPKHSVVKTVDLRKFALDAINTADTCIDKFAKIAGVYTKEAENPANIENAIESFKVYQSANPFASESDQQAWIKDLAAGLRLDEGKLWREVQRVDAVQ